MDLEERIEYRREQIERLSALLAADLAAQAAQAAQAPHDFWTCPVCQEARRARLGGA